MPGSGPARAGALALLVAVGFVLVAFLPLEVDAVSTVGADSQPLPTASNPTWSNRVLKVNFVGSGPDFTVQALSDSRVSLGQTLSGLAEVNDTGHTVAWAGFTEPGVAWSFKSQSTVNGIAVTMAANLTVTRASGYWEEGDDNYDNENSSFGSIQATVVFYINSTTSSSARTVAYTLNVSDWPWSHRSDSLGIQVNSSASLKGAMWTSATSNSIVEVSGHTTIATYQWGTAAQVRYSDGTLGLSAVETDWNQSRLSNQSFVRLDFGSVSGGYSGLEYDPWITLNPSAFKLPAWVFTPASIEVSTGALALVAILAVVATVRRRYPARIEL